YKENQMNIYEHLFRKCSHYNNAKKQEVILWTQQESEKLKKIILNKLDEQIKKHKKEWFGKRNKEIIQALEILKKDIVYAPPLQTLGVIINQWLEKKP